MLIWIIDEEWKDYDVEKEVLEAKYPGVEIRHSTYDYEKDLYDACKEGVIAGAALDVLQEEPISPDNPILSLDNVIVSPHIGGATKEASINASLMCARGIEEVYEGKKPTYPVPGF